MQVHFTKMQGLGNDFVVFDAISQALAFTPEQLRLLAHRQFGIGCDQVLLVESSDMPDVDFRYRIFNADGNEVPQCGNGARCLARFVRDKGLSLKDNLVVATQAGLIYPQFEKNGEITVNMGIPRFAPREIPFQAEQTALQYSITLGTNIYSLGVLSMGNPHAVLFVDEVETAPVVTLGTQLQQHPAFPQSVNVGFMQVLTPSHIRLRVYERGVGETLACGTGACAAAVVGHSLGQLTSPVTVELPGGTLQINWAGGKQDPVFMTGPAVCVFEGVIEL